MSRYSARKFLRRLAQTIGLVLLTVMVLVAVGFLTITIAPNTVKRPLNAQLDGLLQGSLVIEEIGSVFPGGADDVDLLLKDASGRQIGRAWNVSVRSSWWSLIRQLLSSEGLTLIELDELDVEALHLDLSVDPSGTLLLENALQPSRPSVGESSPVVFDLSDGNVDFAWLFVRDEKTPLDVELRSTHSSVLWESSTLELGQVSSEVTLRNPQIPFTDVRLEGASRLHFLEEKTSSGGPLSGLESKTELQLETEGTQIVVTATNDREKFDVAARATVSPKLAARVGLRLDSVATVQASAKGTLNAFTASAALAHEGATVRTQVHVAQANGTRLDGAIAVRSLPPEIFSLPGLSSLDATMNFDAVRSDAPPLEIDRWTANGTVALEAVQVQGRRLPPLSLDVEFDDRTAEILAHVRGESWNRVRARVRFDRRGAVQDVDIEGELGVARVLSFLETDARGEGTIRFEATLSPADSRLNATVSGHLREVRASPEVTAQQLSFDGTMRGRLEDLDISLHVEGENASLGERRFETFEAHWVGTPTAGRMNAELSSGSTKIVASARVSLEGGTFQVDDVTLKATGGTDQLGIDVGELTVRDGRVEFSSVRVSGLGTSNLSGSWGPSGLTLKGFVRDVPIERVQELLSVPLPFSGIADLDVDLKLADRRMVGRLRAVLSEFRTTDEDLRATLPPAEVRLEVAGTGPKMGAWIWADWDSVENERASSLHVETEFETPPMTAWTDPKNLFARLHRVAAHFDFDVAPASPLLPHLQLDEGRAAGHFQFHRSTRGTEPKIQGEVYASGIRATGFRPGASEASAESPNVWFALEEMGFRLRLDSDPERARVHSALTISKENRELVAASVSMRRSLSEVITLIQEGSWTTLPASGMIIVPRVALESLPTEIRPTGLDGFVSADVRFEGTATSPRVQMHLEADDVGPTALRDDFPDFSGVADGSYDGNELTWNVLFESDESDFESRGELQAAWQPGAGFTFERLDAELTLGRFPLEFIPQLALRQIKGPIDVQLRIADWGTDAEQLNVDANLDGVVVRRVPLTGATLTAELKDRSLEGRVHLDGSDYYLTAEGRAELEREGLFGVSWGAAQEGHLQAEQFPLELIQPALGQQVAGLGGRLNANLHASRTPSGPVVTATAEVRDGALQIPSVGQRLRDIDARMTFSEGTLRIDEASFRGTSGRGTLDVRAQMDGVLPKSGSVHVSIERDERLPVSLAGFGTGEAWGDITTDFEMDFQERTVTTETEVDEFQLWLPRLPTQKAQSLEPAEAVTVGTLIGPDRFVEIPLQPVEDAEKERTPWTVHASFDLGDSFWISQGTLRRVQLAGTLRIDGASEMRTSGTLRLPRGQFELNGRVFEIYKGTITLQPDEPDNPIIVVKAHWESPDGILVVATFTGPAQSGEMSLTSEPPLRNDQIVSLLLFGDPSGLGHGADTDNSSNQAAVVGGSVATKGINNILRRYEGIDLSTRVSGEGNNVRPELVVQLTNSLSAQLGYNLEEPSPGKSPDRTLLTFELRLIGGSSLSLTAGDRGTTLFDWVWRYRY